MPAASLFQRARKPFGQRYLRVENDLAILDMPMKRQGCLVLKALAFRGLGTLLFYAEFQPK
jgi:hypothetical protein